MSKAIAGQKKTAHATSLCTKGNSFSITINKTPLNMTENALLQSKFHDVITKVGLNYFENLQFDITVKGGGSTSRIYAARQAFCKSLLHYFSRNMDENSKQKIKNILIAFDKNTLVADPRRQEAKKFGGPGARARYQKSYR
ncbi:hypothetical protein H311_03385 [Anncaliia algerae PRA109]|uniref:Ribosomal protein S9 n=1 Tax=Anncaliia algerae PRA339 TaxID=1288291 RepID=A0A059F4S4_9MICR|nr:hypothetical protein H311_03385 [Anncaliia algerae PRA109]KCZ81994.1 hypothetical protein H312_00476 [Anncaliia algerae PRA339]